MKCPTCNVPLTMSERSGIEIDYCPQCRGVWLDRGELDKIIERATADVAKTKPHEEEKNPRYEDKRYYDKDKDYDKKYYPHKKKGSFLGDIFDF